MQIYGQDRISVFMYIRWIILNFVCVCVWFIRVQSGKMLVQVRKEKKICVVQLFVLLSPLFMCAFMLKGKSFAGR